MIHRNRIGIFVLSVLIPAMVLTGLGIEIYRQQQELILQRLAAEQSQPLETLRQEGPRVRAKMESVFRASKLRFAFYAAAIVLALSVTLLCRFVVWRDYQRETRLAQMRSEFVSNVSHELRTPITSIQMFAETLALGRVKSEERRQQYLETIVHESGRLARMIDDVLAFSRVESKTERYRMELIALTPVVERALASLEPLLAQKSFQVRLELPVESLQVNADGEALEQALLNLLTNAMRYSGDSREISVRLCRTGGEASIEIGDQGIGVASEYRSRIFERFFRAPMPEHPSIAGVGIGLTLVEAIVKAHEGHVELRDNEPRGSVFSLHLPLVTKS